jgi:DNA-binding NarL/FixJ family response regulator
MKQIILATADPGGLKAFSETLARVSGLPVISALTVDQALQAAGRPEAVLVVVDGKMDGTGGRQLLIDILETNAMIASAVMTDMAESLFHDEMEGLGILMPLPSMPGKTDGENLWRYFREVNGYLFEGDHLK